MDITNEDEIIEMKKFVKKKRLKVTVLVNNAAMNPKMDKFTTTAHRK